MINSESVLARRKALRLISSLTLALAIGILLGEICWRITPTGWKIAKNTQYLLQIGSADGMRRHGDFVNAEAALKSAIQLEPERYEAYLDLGNLLLDEGETNRAVNSYNLALKYCGNSPTNVLSRDDQLTERLLIAQKIKTLSRLAH